MGEVAYSCIDKLRDLLSASKEVVWVVNSEKGLSLSGVMCPRYGVPDNGILHLHDRNKNILVTIDLNEFSIQKEMLSLDQKVTGIVWLGENQTFGVYSQSTGQADIVCAG